MSNKVVITLAGPKYLPGAVVQAFELRHTGCDWDHILFHLPSEEIPESYRSIFKELNVEIRELTGFDSHPWTGKCEVVRQFPDHDVLFLDGDNIPLINPEIIRSSPEFQSTGTVFWRDFGTMQPDNPLYTVCGVEGREEWEMESGQLLINTSRCVDALETLHKLNENWRVMYAVTHGDKCTWRMAWLKSGTPWHWGSPEIGILLDENIHGRIVIQKWGDVDAFHHRCNSKLSLVSNWWQPGISLRYFEHLEWLRGRVV